MDRQGLRDRLSREDPHFRALLEKHEEYDRRLQSLQSQRYLSEQEQIEEVTLKKLKLAVKDQMEDILAGMARS